MTLSKEEINDLRLKHCDDAIMKIWKNPNAPPFHEPVDPVKLCIPDYHDKIKNPMDLSTIRSKIKSKEYKSCDEVKDDFKLMIDNCHLYNGINSGIGKMATDLEKLFLTHFNKIPSEESLINKNKKKVNTNVNLNVTSNDNNLTNSKDNIDSKKRVKKGIISQEDHSKCEDMLNEIFKPKYSNIVWPFLEPITDEIVPGYSKIIKHPTDLKTIKRKHNEMSFDSIEEMYKELKTMINNCYSFNAETKKIYDNANELEQIIDTVFEREKNNKSDILNKLNNLINKKSMIDKEIEILEERLNEEEKMGVKNQRTFSVDERMVLGEKIGLLNQIQTTKIAQIINRTGGHLDFVGRNEVEIDMRILSDKVIGEINDYVESVMEIKKNN